MGLAIFIVLIVIAVTLVFGASFVKGGLIGILVILALCAVVWAVSRLFVWLFRWLGLSEPEPPGHDFKAQMAKLEEEIEENLAPFKEAERIENEANLVKALKNMKGAHDVYGPAGVRIAGDTFTSALAAFEGDAQDVFDRISELVMQHGFTKLETTLLLSASDYRNDNYSSGRDFFAVKKKEIGPGRYLSSFASDVVPYDLENGEGAAFRFLVRLGLVPPEEQENADAYRDSGHVQRYAEHMKHSDKFD